MDTNYRAESKPFKILSIDGGGIKGLFSAKVIQSLEETYGEPIGSYFDMICGTSTGGMIALALSVGKSGEEIVDFYKNEGPKIFPKPLPLLNWTRFLSQLLIQAKYTDKNLERAIRTTLAENKMKDASNLLCIPSYNLTAGQPKVFKSPLFINGDNKWKTDAERYMVDVAMATSAAPTYFPIHKIGHELFVDGGVWSNNPAICGFTEALRFFLNHEYSFDGKKIRYDSIQILSISSVSEPNGWSNKQRRKKSATGWLKGGKLLQPFMEGQSHYTHFLLRTLSEEASHLPYKLEYQRITHKPLSKQHMKSIALDKATDSAMADLLALAAHTSGYLASSERHRIDPFFQTKKSFNQIKN